MSITECKNTTRRDLLRLYFGINLCLHASHAQQSVMGGKITTLGNEGTFSVTSSRPLAEVASVFNDTFKMQVTFEEAPHEYSGDVVDVTVREVSGLRAYNVRGGPLTFPFEITGETGYPKNPRAALEAAVSAYHESNYPGNYAVETAGSYFHIVPRARKNVSGGIEVVQSPLDSILAEEPKERRLDMVFGQIIQSIRAGSPFSVKVASNPFNRGEQPEVLQSLAGLSVRAVMRILLDELNAFHQQLGLPSRQRTWVLLYSKGWSSYYLTIQ